MTAVQLASPATAKQLVTFERHRQMAEEGWTAEHDDRHSKCELIAAAKCYLYTATDGTFLIDCLTGRSKPAWPWDWTWYKPFDQQHRGYFPQVAHVRCLVKAAALTLAEIARLQRAVEREPSTIEVNDLQQMEAKRLYSLILTELTELLSQSS